MDIQAMTSTSWNAPSVDKPKPTSVLLDDKVDGSVKIIDRNGKEVVGVRFDVPEPEYMLDKLSPEMIGRMLKFQQTMDQHFDHRMGEIEAEKAADAQAAGSLRISTKHSLDDIANDPAFAAKRARELGTFPQLTLIAEEDFPKNGDPASVWEAFRAKSVAQMEQNGQVTRDRSNYYHKMIAEGLPPAEIYAKLLEFNANLSQSYSDTVSPQKSYASGGYKANNQAQYDYLMKALGKPVTPSEKTV